MNPLQRARASQRVSEPKEIAAPIKGWNTRDAFEAMDPLDAILCDNWYPTFAGLVTRNGSASFATGMGAAAVQTLAWFNSGSSSIFVAACNGKFFNITAGGAVGAALATGFTSDIWQSVLFNKHLFFVNGVDTPQVYDGATFANSTFTGVTLTTLKGVGVFNSRLYFWTGVDPSFWYGPVNGITGALSNFDLSMVTEAGGNLINVQVFSYDGGTGIQDYTVFMMSSGECLMYSGTDPSNAGNWSLIGRYLLPPPIALRGTVRFGGDIYSITANDHQQFSKQLIALKLGETPAQTKISGAATAAYLAGSTLPGWQSLYYPAGQRIIYNIPNANGTFSQHVYNTSTQAWCRFTGMNSYCWGVFGRSLYFGAANGVVYQADTGSADAGTAIIAQCQQAWQLLETPLKKRVAAVRPAVQSNGPAAFNFGLGYDYKPANINIPSSSVEALGNVLVWGASNWGSPNVWGASGVTDPRWSIAGGDGGAISFSLTASITSTSATWIRTDLLIQQGNAL